MKNKSLVSIIVPIYKVEKYLNKCVDSIINQTYTNLEIILVDDGSPDNCGKICDDYAKIDSRIKVIHKKNGGLSDARNVGFESSHGDWIAFIDSDDYISFDYIETLISICDDCHEIGVVLPYVFYEDDTFVINHNSSSSKIIIYDNFSALEEMLYQKKFDTSAWGKIYKRSLLNNVSFPYGKIYEDISTVFKLFLNSKTVAFLPEKKYFYLKRKSSIMGGNFKEKDMDYIEQSFYMLNEIKKTENLELISAATARFVNANFSILLKIKDKSLYSNYINLIYSNIKKYRKEVFFNKNVRIKTKIAIFLNFFKIL